MRRMVKMKAEDWQAEWQMGMEKPEKSGVSPCRQVVLIGELAEAQRTIKKILFSLEEQGLGEALDPALVEKYR